MLLGFAVAVALSVALGLLLLWAHSISSPKFGNLQLKLNLAVSDHYDGSRFHNPEDPAHNTQPKIQRMARGVLGRTKSARPQQDLGAGCVDFSLSQTPKVSWLGHSSVLLTVGGQRLLFDPVFGAHASPFGGVACRFEGSLPLNLTELPMIDAVLISHDHYDHLDYDTIVRFDQRFKRYIVPLGVGAHLIRFGVDPQKITELDWWQHLQIQDTRITLTPAHHSSGRSILGQKKTLWGGFTVHTPQANVYFSGDSGYGGHFAQIGERLGPFDLALMECGQYHDLWSEHHMLPHQTVQATLDVQASAVLPIHWGAFALSAHAWFEPIERFSKAASSAGLHTLTPAISQTVEFGAVTYPWWREYQSGAAQQSGYVKAGC